MKKMKIEKQLIFADQVKRIVSLQVQENLTYRHEAEGIRAIGPLYIKGEYEGSEGLEKFQETLEMDVLAPNDKLGTDAFRLDIADYHAKEQDDSIQVMITLNIQGLKEDQANTKANTTNKEERQTQEMDAVYTDQITEKEEQRFANDAATAQPEIPAVTEINAESDDMAVETAQENTALTDDFEDLFKDAESTYTSYRIVVARRNDTYAAIAQRYDVDETALRDTNKNKEILPKTLVILPFVQNDTPKV